MTHNQAEALQDLRNRLDSRVWSAYFVWIEHKSLPTGRLVKVFAKDAYHAHLYAQEIWGEEHVVTLPGESAGEEDIYNG